MREPWSNGGKEDHGHQVSRTTNAVPIWAVIVTPLLSIIGLGLSIYLTVAHFEGTQILACSTKGIVDCATVTTSPQSNFLGVPVVFLGLGYFVAMCALNSPWAWRATAYWLHVTRLVLAAAAMVFVLWLVYAELMIINHICLFCTEVHIVSFLLLIVLTLVSPAQLGWVRSRSQ